MSGLLDFVTRFDSDEPCIEPLAELRWPGGYVCPRCGGREAWRLKARPRTYECAGCHHQESVTAGTIFHRTRTALPKWFLAADLMSCDKRGVSAKFLQRELGVASQTAWTMAHKLRHGLSEDPAHPISGFLEADETFVGGRGDPARPGRSTDTPNKSLVVAVVEKVPAPKNTDGKPGHAVKRQHGFYAGSARIAVLPEATAAELGAFIQANVAAQSHLLTDGFLRKGGIRGTRPLLAITSSTRRSFRTQAPTLASSSPSSIPSSAISRRGWLAPIMASAPNICRATCGNGTIASIGGI